MLDKMVLGVAINFHLVFRDCCMYTYRILNPHIARQRIVIFVLLHCVYASNSQTIEISVANLQTKGAVLSSLSGEKVSRIDTVNGIGNGRFTFSAGSKISHPGFYRLSLDRNRWIDFLIDGEDVRLSTDASNILDSMKVEASESNRLYYSFIKQNKQYKSKSELLQLVLSRYPKDDPYYGITRTRLTQLQKVYSDFIEQASSRKPASFIARYVRSAQLAILSSEHPPEKQLAYLKSQALNHLDFTDDGLIYSDLFTSKSIEYLTYYRNPQLPKELLEKEFMVAVDTILNKANVNHIVYQHIVEYLIDGFKKFGFEKCIDYILDNYVIKDDLCLNGSHGSSIQRMIDQKKKLPVGAAVPSIVLPDSSGNATSLMGMSSEKTLILFYSSACPHCQTMIPQLTTKYGASLTVYAISLDSSRTEWLNFIRVNKLAWINVNDTKGWSGTAATDYSVYATPTMILVDKDKKVIAKPLTLDELAMWL